jgi:hypothetical protein
MKTKDYAYFFESISEDTPLREYRKYINDKATFKDPFHEVKGIRDIYDIFQKMYQNLDEPKFKIDEMIQEENIGYIRWYFSYKFKGKNETKGFYGVSRVVFDEDLKMISHEDYWDASENIYENIPILSFFIKFVKNKIKA